MPVHKQMSGKPGWKHTPEARAKIAKAKLGQKHTPAAIEKMRRARRGQNNGASNPMWRGGIRNDGRGRVYEYAALGKPRNNYIARSRRVAADMLGRPLKGNEDVHHKNEIKGDDRPTNLEVSDHADHARLHCCKRARDTRGRFQ